MSAEQEMPQGRLIDIQLDEKSIKRDKPEIEHEREIAIFDLLEENTFQLVDSTGGPYKLKLGIIENRLVFDIRDEAEHPLATHILSLSPLQRVIKDYFLICESYFAAIKTASPSKIEAIDMGRRGLHDTGSQILQERLEGKIAIDHNTSRRLFTLVCALHWRG